MRALLDTSVLIALLDVNHVHHRLASAWLTGHHAGWASCPITLNGCVRILSQPQYPNRLTMQAVVNGLTQAMQHPMHRFWAHSINPLDATHVRWEQVLMPVDITDAYLLALAVKEGGCLATFDQKISLTWVSQAQPHHLIVLG